MAKDSAAKGANLGFLVDFEPGRDLLELIGLEQEQGLGVRAHVVTEGDQSPTCVP